MDALATTIDNTELELREIINKTITVDTELTLDQQTAQRNHLTFIAAAKLGNSASLILREAAIALYLDNGYLEIKVPYDNDPTQYMTFGDFRSWCYYSCEKAGLSTTHASNLSNYILNVVDPVSKGLIENPTTKQPYTVEEVSEVKESILQATVPAARRIMQDSKKSDQEKMNVLSELLEVATNPKVQLEQYKQTVTTYFKGNSGGNLRFEVGMAYVGNKMAYLIVVDEDTNPKVELSLRGRADIKSKTVDDLIELLKDEAGYNKNVSDEELEEWLQNQ